MNTLLLLFLALPIATIILSIVLLKILKCPALVAATFFAIYLILTYAIFGSDFLILAILYTILSYITAVITKIICKIIIEKEKIIIVVLVFAIVQIIVIIIVQQTTWQPVQVYQEHNLQ